MKLKTYDVLSFDIETADKELGGIVDFPTMVSCAGDDDVFVAVGEADIRSLLSEMKRISEAGTKLVGHNSWYFDIPAIRRYGYDLPLDHDTMVCAYLDDETQALGLESLCVKYLGTKGWKTDGDWKNFDPRSPEAAQYAARDARYTLVLFQKLQALLGSRMRTIDLIIRPARIALDKQTERGIWINSVAVARERQSALSVRERSLGQLRGMAGDTFNPNSPAQVGAYLQSMRVPLPLTHTGKPATGVKVLNGIKSTFTETLLRYRGAVKTLSTYCRPYEEIIERGDGRVHPQYTLIRTLTGRSSAKDTNVQNLSRQYKDFFGAPPGKVFVEYDFSAIEFRVAAWLAQEPTILDEYARDANWDPHRFVASLFYQRPADSITKFERQVAKSANFGLLFLGNGFTLYEYAEKMGVPISLDEAEELYRFFHSTFPGFKKFYAECKEELKTTGQAKCPTGHIRHFGDYDLLLPGMRLEALRQAVNCKVQNTAAHLAYIALGEIHRRELPHIGFVHDAFFFEFDSVESARNSIPSIEYCMTEHPRKFLAEHFDLDFNIPLCIEGKIHEPAA